MRMRLKLFLGLLVCLMLVAVGPAHAAGTATMTLNPVSSTVPMSTPFSVVVELNVGSEQVSSADLVLEYDPTKLEVAKVNEVMAGSKLFPVNTVSIDNATGRVVVNSKMNEVTETFTGRADWLSLSLASKATPGQAQLNFSCLEGDTTDTNAIQSGTGADIIDCQGLVNGVYTVSASAPTFTPTPTPELGIGGTGGTGKGGLPEATATPTPTVPATGVVETTVSILALGLGMLLLAGVLWLMNKA